MIEQLSYADLSDIIPREFPFVVQTKRRILRGNRAFVPDFDNPFGPLATEWNKMNTSGVLFRDRRWDYLYGFRFKDEADAVLFRLMVGGA